LLINAKIRYSEIDIALFEMEGEIDDRKDDEEVE
jgi:hypothetical protein